MGSALLFGAATGASAAVKVAPIANPGSAIVKAAQGCGAGFWRGPGGARHPMARKSVCPAGYHIGPEGRKRWPN